MTYPFEKRKKEIRQKTNKIKSYVCVRDHLKLEQNLGRKKKRKLFTIVYCDKREGLLAECHAQFM